ncbi:mechanosensitive ion channel domain-containing protein [Siccirubricoccus phaeus]|uniref:mechanosensitive ion channel domain-containing protein n=1 Tax=Siccirubricoccus phaeus TaxID=2595053 RepID=UPI00165A5934|nr:mechanosensitive ion channel domain-containing protein [Siccirubricoccus phaeus]
MTLLRLLLTLLPLLCGALPAAAQPARPAGTLTAEDIDRLTSLLEDEGRRAEFLRTLEALAAASRAQAGAVGEGTAAPAPAPTPVTRGGTAVGEGAEAEAVPPGGGVQAPAPGAARPGAQPAAPQAAPQGGPQAAAPAAPGRPAAPAAEAEAAPPQSAAAGTAPGAPAGGAPGGAPARGAAPQGAAAPAPAAAPAAPAPTPAPATPAPAATPPAEDSIMAPNTIGAQLLLALSTRLSGLSDSLLRAARTVADLPSLLAAIGALAQDPVTQRRLLDAAWKLVLLLGLGLVAEAAVNRAVARPRARLDALAPAIDARWRFLRRLPLLIGRLILDLLPIAAFAMAVYGLFGLVNPLPTTKLVGLLLAHVYILARGAFALACMLFSPASNHLRLIPCSDALAVAALRWIRRLMLVGVGGYALAEAGLFFGLPWSAYDAILNLTLLVISLMLVRLVLQQREPISAVLRAAPIEPGEEPSGSRLALRGLRNQLAEVWHVLVILWLVASWMVWALALENGFERLLIGTLLTLLVIGLAKALDEGVGRLTGKLLHPSPELAKRWPGLPTRAATYVPPLRLVASLLLGAIALVLVLEVWGLGSLAWFAEGTLGHRLLATLLNIGGTLALALVVWEMANSAIQRRLVRARDVQAVRSARVRTLLPMLRTVVGVVILVFVVLNALSQVGVNVAPLLAGAGVVGLAIGFGSQTLVRDVITGVFLLLEDAVAVGDVVNVGGKGGVVEHLSIRSIKLRDGDGAIHIVPFSAVTTVTNSTRDFAFAMIDILVDYDTDTDVAGTAIKEIVTGMRGEARWQTAIRDDFDLWGVDSLGQLGVQIRGRVRTEPSQRWPVQRELMRRIKRRFEEMGIDLARQVMAPHLWRTGRPPAEEKAAE